MFKDYDDIIDSVENYLAQYSFMYTESQQERIVENLSEKLESIDDYFSELIEKATTLKHLEHPDAALARIAAVPDKIDNKYSSYFIDISAEYNINLQDIEAMYEYMAEDAKQEYIRLDYATELENYLQDVQEAKEEKEYAKKIASLKKSILAKVKKAVQIKQAELVNSFEDEQKADVKKLIVNLEKEGRILKGRVDAGKKGVIFLTFVK